MTYATKRKSGHQYRSKSARPRTGPRAKMASKRKTPPSYAKALPARKRSRPTPRRATPRPSAGASALSKHRVLWDPFKRHRDAKLHDGSTIESHGRQLRSVDTVVNTGGDDIVITLFAGLGANAVSHVIDPNATEKPAQKNFTFGSGEFGGVQFTCPPNSTTTAVQMRNQQKISKWRNLSTAMKVTLLNNEEENDGWFELIRTNRATSIADYDLWPVSNTVMNSGNQIVAVLAPSGGEKLDSVELVNDSSYVAGKLSELKNHTWQLKRTNDTSEFINMEQKYATYAAMERNVNARYLSLEENDSLQPTMHRHLVDPDFDEITLIIHGRTDGKTQALVETCSNFELVYDDASDLAQFMTPNTAMVGVEEAVRASNMATI